MGDMRFFNNSSLIKTTVVFSFILFAFVFMLFWQKIYISDKSFVYESNLIIKDRYGVILRSVPDKKGERHIWAYSKEIPEIVKHAFIAAEDEDFHVHRGFNLKSIIRAFKDNIKAGKIVSGASTITQQVVKIIRPGKRSYLRKFLEICSSIILEIASDKEKILEQYLNRVSLGNNIRGIKLASLLYFGKSLADLNANESAILAALPKAPGYLDPYSGNREALLERKEWVLARMNKLGYLTNKEYQKSLFAEISFKKYEFPMNAPHWTDFLLTNYNLDAGEIHTTIDYSIQKQVEKIIVSHRDKLHSRGARQSSCIILKNKTMEILSMVGSIEYSGKDEGYNDGTNALRSPGSTLKPFLYALGLQKGYNTSLILSDTERIYKSAQGEYLPRNYDKNEYGPVGIRTALGNSLNLSAVNMIHKLGYAEFYNLLDTINLINFKDKGPDYYGLGMAIGNPEVSLHQLVCAYAMLANRGTYSNIKHLLKEGQTIKKEVFSPHVAYIITDILSDSSARMLVFDNSKFKFPFKIAIKTGTSTKWRDGWTIGYTPEYTIGVWVGNFDGSPTYSLAAAEGGTPIFYDLVNFLYLNTYPDEFKMPEGIIARHICSYSGMKPSPKCRHLVKELFLPGTEPAVLCAFHNKSEDIHHLPADYALWLYNKEKRGASGKYRLAGFNENLDKVFQDPWTAFEPGHQTKIINVHNIGQKQEQQSNKDGLISEKKHHTIGVDYANVSCVGRTPEGDDIDKKTQFQENKLQIIYPLHNDKFIINKHRPEQFITLQAVSKKPVDFVVWLINGIEYAKTKPPYKTYWELKKGVHKITAIDSFYNIDEIKVIVK